MEGASLRNREQRSIRELPPKIELQALHDPLVERWGHGPRSMYVETVWGSVLGPTATLLYRRLGSWAEATPEATPVDMIDLASSLGLGESLARNSRLARGIGRLVCFEAAQWYGDRLAVRTALAPLPERHTSAISASALAFHRQRVPLT